MKKFHEEINELIEFNTGLDELISSLRKKYKGYNNEFFVGDKLFVVGDWDTYLEYRDSALLSAWLEFKDKNLVDENDFYKRKIEQGFYPCLPLKNLIGFVWEV